MAREHGTLWPDNPWPKIAWGMTAAVLVVGVVLGFGILDRFQQNDPTLDLWSAICRGLGIASDTAPSAEAQPALRTPTRIAWTEDTLRQIAAGDVKHGEVVALNCSACHGEGGRSNSNLVPTLAGQAEAVIFKQLDDYRSGKRPWGVMNAIAKAVSPRDSADVAAYFAVQPGGLAPIEADRFPESGRSLRERDPVKRLVFAGEPRRGIPPCAACHGPGGFRLGAPALEGQHADYIERQLAAFAQGLRQNDIFWQMRGVARQLTADEMHAVAAFYGSRGGAQGSQGLAMR